MTSPSERDRVAPSSDDVGKARNALSLIGARRAGEALALLEAVSSPNAFSEIVRAFALKDIGDRIEEAEKAVSAAGMGAPGIFRHLMPWRRSEKLEPHNQEGCRLQALISLRLFNRYDLCGWACRTAHRQGFRNPDGSPLLVDVPSGPLQHVCLIDGQMTDDLAGHIAEHGVSPKAYREFFGLGPRPG